MAIQLETINPLNFRGWDDLVLSKNNCAFFHSTAWVKVLTDSYKYKPVYFTLIDNNELKVLIPLMEINSFLTGRRGISLPFSDYYEPIINGKIDINEILTYIAEYGKKSGWKYIELRPGRKV